MISIAWKKETSYSQCVVGKNSTKYIKSNFLLGVPPDWFRSILAFITCEKVCSSKKPGWKKNWNQRCDNSLMAKQVNLCVLFQVSLGLGTKFTRIVVTGYIDFHHLTIHLVATFHLFHPGFLGCTLYSQLGYFWIIFF